MAPDPISAWPAAESTTAVPGGTTRKHGLGWASRPGGGSIAAGPATAFSGTLCMISSLKPCAKLTD
eukprot:6903751-Lingulodinium_polyedra.AAC.1